MLEKDIMYSQNVSKTLLRKFEKIFISKFRFEGDEKFTPRLQRLFFSTIFNRGVAGVYNSKKYGPIIIYYYPAVVDKKTTFSPNGKVISARGNLAFLFHFTGQAELYSLKLNTKNCAFFYSSEYQKYENYNTLSGILKPFCEEFGRIMHRAHLDNLQGKNKLVIDNTSFSQQFFNDLHKFGPLELLKQKTEQVDNQNSILNTLSNDLEKILTVIKFDIDIEKQFSAAEKYLTLIAKINGFSYNQTFKKERMLNSEIENENQDYKITEFYFKETIDNFIDDYKKVFGKKLILIDNLTDKINGENNDSKEHDKKLENGEKNDK